jgi:hypothetical protein
VLPLLVVEFHPGANPLARVGHVLIGVQVNLLILEAAPQAFDEHVVDPAPFAIHADLDASVFENLGEGLTGELASLVGIEDFGGAVVVQGFAQRLHAEFGVECVGESPAQDLAAVPVHDRHQVEEALAVGCARRYWLAEFTSR